MKIVYQVLLALQLLVTICSAIPASALHDLSGDDSIPFLDNEAALAEFNLSSPADPSDDGSSLAKRAVTLNYFKYSITMDGCNPNNFQNFFVTGSMLVTNGVVSPATTNGANAVEVIISIGSPAVNPIAGSIRYCTNRYLYSLIGGANANSKLDFARVQKTGSTVNVNVDTTLAASNQLSNFNARSGLTANVFLVASGRFTFTVAKGGAVSGRAVLQGSGYIFAGTAPYTAIISGKVLGQGTIHV
jgi:hypothetical protein